MGRLRLRPVDGASAHVSRRVGPLLHAAGTRGGSPQVELLQALEGPSIYHEWLDSGRVGLHHVGVLVETLDAATESMRRAGYDVLQSGRGYGLDGDGGYAYFDTERDFEVIVEAIEVPKRRREPDFVWRI